MRVGVDRVQKGRTSYKFSIGVPLGLIFSTIIVYVHSLWYGFIFDDLPTIVSSLQTSVIDGNIGLFASERWVPRVLNHITNFYWGSDPLPYRLINLVIHLLAGLFVFMLLVRLFQQATKSVFLHTYAQPIATLASMLFLLHPVQTQTVTYITQMRLEGMVTFFMVSVLVAFVYAVTTHNIFLKNIFYALSFFLAALAAGTKEISIVLPVLIVLVDWFFLAQTDRGAIKSRIWAYGAYAGVVWGFFLHYGLLKPDLVKVLVTHPLHCNHGNVLTTHASELINCFSFALSQFKVLAHYIFIFFCPVNLSFDYDVKLARHIADVDVWLPALGLLIFAALLVLCYRSWQTRILTFGGLWFFIVMLPRTSIVPSTELICDYKTFPASLGMMIILAYMIVYFVVRLVPAWPMINAMINVRGALIVVQCLGCVALAWASNMRTEVWSSEVVFWKDSLEKGPKARVFNNYALSLLEQGKVDEAIEHFHKAIEKDDCYASPHARLAAIYHAQNKHDKASHHHSCALAIGGGELALLDKKTDKEIKNSSHLFGCCYHAEENYVQSVDGVIKKTF